MLTAVTGINWGDEGKGRVIDLLAENADIVARYQGGNNAGHTVVTEKGKFILNLLPSGILHPEVTCVLGTGMVIDLEHLAGEMEAIEARGVKVEPENLSSPIKLPSPCRGTRYRMGWKRTALPKRAARSALPGAALLTLTATSTAKRPCGWVTFCIWTRSAPRTACT